jgi:hypothetical protein
VPKSTEDKVYSAVVSPITKVLPICGWNMLQQEMNLQVNNILKYLTSTFSVLNIFWVSFI